MTELFTEDTPEEDLILLYPLKPVPWWKRLLRWLAR